MKRSNRVKWGELKVGLLIVFAIAALIWASFTGGGTSIFENKVSYKAYFSNVNGLVTGAPVWISGVEVGNVSRIEFINLDSARQIELEFKVIERVRNMITTDARVMLGTIGLLGDKYLEIVPGDLSNPMVEPGSYVRSREEAGLSGVMARSDDLMRDVSDMMKNLDLLAIKMNQGKGTMGRLFNEDTLYVEMMRLMSSMTVLLDGLQKNQNSLTGSLNSVATNIDSITTRVENNSGTIGKLIADPGLYDRLHSSTGRIDSILAKINQGDGTAGAMVNDEALYQDVKNLIVRIDNLVADIEENPRKYFKFSVF